MQFSANVVILALIAASALIAAALAPILAKVLLSYFSKSSKTTLTVTHTDGTRVEVVVNATDEESVRRFLKTVEAPHSDA
jgi:redox-regulated HSP33 family molecular chaperone